VICSNRTIINSGRKGCYASKISWQVKASVSYLINNRNIIKEYFAQSPLLRPACLKISDFSNSLPHYSLRNDLTGFMSAVVIVLLLIEISTNIRTSSAGAVKSHQLNSMRTA
jgi:hypothetical protein